MRLCVGVFAKILRLCTDKHDYELLNELAKAVDSKGTYSVNPTTATRTLRCINQFTSSGSQSAKSKENAYATLKRNAANIPLVQVKVGFSDKIIGILDEHKWPLIILAFLDIVDKDSETDRRPLKFEEYFGMSRAEFLELKSREFTKDIFSGFLSGLFLYSLLVPNNSVGRCCKPTSKCSIADAVSDAKKASNQNHILQDGDEKKIVGAIASSDCEKRYECVMSIEGNWLDRYESRREEVVIGDFKTHDNLTASGKVVASSDVEDDVFSNLHIPEKSTEELLQNIDSKTLLDLRETEFTDVIANALLQMGLEGLFTYCGKGFVRAFEQLSEYSGNSKPPHYESVASFWYDGVDNESNSNKIYPGNVISLNGVISLFIPLCPRHPRAIPGKKAETWINLRKSEKERKSNLDFGTRDFVLWNDGVLVPPKNIARKAIIGFTDKYGYVGHGCLPLIIDLTIKEQLKLYNKLVEDQPSGYEAFVKGRVTPFTIHIAQDFGLAFDSDADADKYPNYVLEVHEVKLSKRHNVLTGTMWMGYDDDSIFPIYCHLLDKREYLRALVALNAEYKTDSGKVVAVHDTDPYELVNHGSPKLNQYLADILKKI